MSSRAHRINQGLLLLILLSAALLRFYHLDHSSLWSDEGNTWALLSRPFAQIAHDAAADIHPPGYYWLLKLWSMLFGATALAMRSFSALLGVILVYLVYHIGLAVDPALGTSTRAGDGPKGTENVETLPDRARDTLPVALLAALLTALNPFQIYYSQEARMYMLLTVASAGLIWSLLYYLHRLADRRKAAWHPLIWYALFGLLGLWTHYSFPIVLLAAGLGYLSTFAFVRLSTEEPGIGRFQVILPFLLANTLIVLGYLPWLPTAIHRVLAWPAGGTAIPWSTGVALTVQTLLVGPLTLTEFRWLWLFGALLLPVLGVIALYRRAANRSGSPGQRGPITLLLLWWLLPIGLMFGAGLFNNAFLKFLLTASPAWLLLVANATILFKGRWVTLVTTLALVSGASLLAWQTLPTYYTSPTVRDNYAGVAAYIAAIADPTQDLVLLDAPGQREVWAYYDPGIPMIALPQTRPPDPAATQQTLAETTAGRRNLYALFWATDEADPDQLVERWLDQLAFKGIDSWQGNLRFVLYTLSDEMNCTEFPQAVRWGESIELVASCLPQNQPQNQQAINAGEAALVGLRWRTTAPLTARYKVTIQLLDERNLVIAQRDGEPVGGSAPTSSWEPNALITDNHGVVIPLGTPPGTYRMIVALYDSANGMRLPMGDGDAFDLGTVTITRPAKAIPASIIPVQYRLDRPIGPLTLVGYAAYRQGMQDTPLPPIAVGDLVEFTFVWQAPMPLPADWPSDLTATLSLGEQAVTFPLAGTAYPTGAWNAGELVQYRLLVPFDGRTLSPQLRLDGQVMMLKTLPVD